MQPERKHAIIVGAGPAGLMAAEQLAQSGVRVSVFDAMPSVGRKFLMAGRGGLNITHSEPADAFHSRYGSRAALLARWLTTFGAGTLREWIHALGIETFVGSSGRVFPKEMKAAPLLRAWLQRLRASGVQIRVRHRWQGGIHALPHGGYALRFETPEGEIEAQGDVIVLALGGGSWARLGSDGAWHAWLSARDVELAPLAPSNCGFDADWSEHFRSRFAGEALKSVVARCLDQRGVELQRQGECVITQHGIEGGFVYAFSAHLREQIATQGQALLTLDLAPGRSFERVLAEVSHPRGARSMGSHLQSRVGIHGVKAGLLRECLPREAFSDMQKLAHGIKALPLRLLATRPIDEAISTAGGVCFEALDAQLMLHALPGVFCAGEMLDWEAPTGGYLLTACFATGRAAGQGAANWLLKHSDR